MSLLTKIIYAMTPETLNIIGLFASIIGTLILAFCIIPFLYSMKMVIDAHEIFILSILHPTKPVVQVTGVQIHMNLNKKKYQFYSWIGVFFIICGFLAQLTSYLFLK